MLVPQAALNFGHQVFGQAQLMEGLLESLSGPLRLAAIACKALVCCEAAALSGFGVFFRGSCAWGHGALLRFVRVCCGGSLPTRTRDMTHASVRVEVSLRTGLPGLPAFF